MAAERRPVARELGSHLLSSVGGYVRGNLLISLIAGVAAYIAMLIVGVPFALPLAVAVAVLDLIPLVGATLGAIVCVIVAAAGGGWLPGLILAVYFIVYQQVENNLIQTTVYSRTVALSPLAVLVASLCGAAVAGIVGVLLAIPVAATVAIALVEIRALRTGDVPARRSRSSRSSTTASRPRPPVSRGLACLSEPATQGWASPPRAASASLPRPREPMPPAGGQASRTAADTAACPFRRMAGGLRGERRRWRLRPIGESTGLRSDPPHARKVLMARGVGLAIVSAFLRLSLLGA